jgi:hypothetical protein
MPSDSFLRKLRRRKCLVCKELFVPDPLNASRQKVCSCKDCQAQRKRASQAAWQAKKANQDYFSGAANVARVQAWRKRNPGYWRRQGVSRGNRTLQDASSAQVPDNKPLKARLTCPTLQDSLPSQTPLLVGLISKFTGSTLQDDIVESVRLLIDQGAAILGSGSGMGERSNQTNQTNENQTLNPSSTRTSAPFSLELDRPPPG